MKVRSEVVDLVTSKIQVGDIREEKIFTDNVVINSSSVYSVRRMTNYEILPIATSFLDSLVNNRVTAQTATNAIVLAHHLSSLERDNLLFVKYNTWECPPGEGTLVPKVENGHSKRPTRSGTSADSGRLPRCGNPRRRASDRCT